MTTRQTLAHGLEREFNALRLLRPGRRVGEIAFFSALWMSGIALGLAGLSTTSPLEWPLRLASVAVVAAALNAFYLLSHCSTRRRRIACFTSFITDSSVVLATPTSSATTPTARDSAGRCIGSV
jgi:hypothetical protein